MYVNSDGNQQVRSSVSPSLITAAKSEVQRLTYVSQGGRDSDAFADREAKAVGLSRAMIWVLPDDDCA